MYTRSLNAVFGSVLKCFIHKPVQLFNYTPGPSDPLKPSPALTLSYTVSLVTFQGQDPYSVV